MIERKERIEEKRRTLVRGKGLHTQKRMTKEVWGIE